MSEHSENCRDPSHGWTGWCSIDDAPPEVFNAVLAIFRAARKRRLLAEAERDEP